MVDVLDRRAFIGRERELARLLALLGEVEAGAGRTAVVAGEAGVGKSRLIARLAEAAGDRAEAATGACLPTASGGLPYAPFVEILRRVVAQEAAGTVAALLGPGRSILARLLPEIAVREADLPASFDADPTAQGRLFELILGVVQRLARRRPLVLAVEDVQWADRSTRELLAFLMRALLDDRVLVVVTVRSEDPASAGDTLAFLAELERDEGVERIDLEPFSREEVADQVGALLDDRPSPALVDRVYERSDGNPFFVEELVLAGAADRSDLPAVVRDVVTARLAGLSPSTRDVVRAATLCGRAIDEELVSDVLGIDGQALAAALREGVAAGILEREPASDGGPATFRHGLLREAAERELFPAERAALHEAFAEALVRTLADGAPVPAADLARHWDGAGQPARALRPMVDAALAAESVYAWPEALDRWQRARVLFASIPDADAISGLSLAELDGRAADCAVLAGDYRTAIALGRAAIDAVDPSGDGRLAGSLHNRLRWYLWESGDRRGAAEAVEAALRLIPAAPPSQARAAALSQQAGILLFEGRYEESLAVAREAIEMARALGAPGEAALALGVTGWDLAALGDIEAGLRQFREGEAIATALGSAEGTALATINLVTLLDQVGRSKEQLEVALKGYELMQRLGLARTYGALLLGYGAKAQLVLGHWDDLDRTTAMGLRAGASDRGELWLSINRARLFIARGRFEDGEALLDRARAIEARVGGTEFLGSLLVAETELAMWRADLAGVRRAGEAGIALAQRQGMPDSSLAWLAILVVRAEADAVEREVGATARQRQDAAAVRHVADVETAIRTVLGARPELRGGGRSDAIQALLEAERTRLEDRPSPAAWVAVANAWQELERPYSAAYATFRAAEATLADHGSREDAEQLLRRARAGSIALGAEPLLRLIDALARAARLEVVDARAPGAGQGDSDPYGFTPREREVLELVADGRTNQQIAERLFITRKTASVHVSNIMAKLGVANRGEAAAMAHRLGLVS